jgi:HlyD family secretion protein
VDIPRESAGKRRRIRRILYGVGPLAIIALVTAGVLRLEPAIPSVERSLVWMDTVKRGSMVRQVRGAGTLVPELMLWIPAPSEGRLKRILVLPGTPVKADTILLELTNPELELTALDAEAMFRAAEAELSSLRVRLQSELLTLQASAVSIEAEHNMAVLQTAADTELAVDGLVADLTLQISRVHESELGRRVALEQQRVEISAESTRAQLAAQQARVDQLRTVAELRRRQVDQLMVRAGTDGVLQELPIEIGLWVTPGVKLAKVADSSRLKAEVRIPETRARDVTIGQVASIDTRNGIVPGRVTRIDPAVRNGTVTVDVALEGSLPRGSRPDLSVDGTIELQRLEDVLYVGRPAFGEENSTIGLFRLRPGEDVAERVQVKLGSSSVSTVEIIEGLEEHDEVILSEMSNWDANEKISLR